MKPWLGIWRTAVAQQVLTVYENGRQIDYSFADLMKYHGPSFPGGVAHAFKVMERAFPLLAPDGYLERREIEIDTSFRGPGGRDAFEMVTRVVSREEYHVDPGLGERWADGTHRENYFFRLKYRGSEVELIIEPGHIRDEFYRLGAKKERTVDEDIHLNWLKQEMTDWLMALDARAVYAPVER